MTSLTFILLLLTVTEGRLFFPTRMISPWTPIRPDHLVCPHTPLEGDKPNNTWTTEVNIIDMAQVSLADGQLCEAISWETSCDFRWYGPQYITQQMLQTTPDSVHCKQAVLDQEMGKTSETGYPPAECSWNNIYVSRRTTYHLTEHKVKVEPYLGSYLDGIFRGGSCKTSECLTISSSSLWLASTGLSSDCRPWGKASISVEGMMSPGGSVDYHRGAMIHLPTGESSRIEDGCLIKICDSVGLKLSQGLWIQDFLIRETSASSLVPRPCSGKETVLGLPHSRRKLHDLKIEARIRALACREALLEIRVRGSITNTLLGVFQPRREGIEPVYRLNNGTIERALAQIKIVSDLKRTDLGLSYVVNGTVMEDREDPIKTDSGCLIWRGTVRSCQGVLDLMTESHLMVDRLHGDEDTFSRVRHPVVKRLSGDRRLVGNQNVLERWQKGEGGDIVEDAGNFFRGLGVGAFWLVIGLIGGCILLIFVCNMANRMRRRGRKREPEGFEMGLM